MRGRPTKYTEELAYKICERMAKGETLRSICRDEDFPTESCVRAWAKDDYEGFYAQYARARDLGLDAMAEELFDIADDGSNDFMTISKGDAEYTIENKEWTTRSRLRVDTRKWYLSKLAPKRYGDKLTHELTGEDGAPVMIRLVDDVPRS